MKTRKEIIEHFDGFIESRLDKFASTVEPVYKLLKWTWRDEKHSPTKEEIKETLLELADNIKKDFDMNDIDISTGGLEVGIKKNETQGVWYMYMNFVIDDYCYLNV